MPGDEFNSGNGEADGRKRRVGGEGPRATLGVELAPLDGESLRKTATGRLAMLRLLRNQNRMRFSFPQAGAWCFLWQRLAGVMRSCQNSAIAFQLCVVPSPRNEITQ